MAISDITKPMALDETLQATNGKMDSVITKLQGIIDALGLDTSVYKPKGNITCAALVPALLIDDNLGNVYNVTDNGTTTSDFVEGAGKPIHVGDNVAIVDIGTGGQSEYKFDLLAGMVDLTNYVQKSQTAGLLKNDGTVDTKDYAEKVAGATSGNLAGLNASGNLTDSGWNGAKDTTSISGNPISISGLKANQLASNPIITLEPIQAGSGTPSPSNIRAISGYDKIEVLSCGKNICQELWRQGDWDGSLPSIRVSMQNETRIHLKAGVTYYIYNRGYTLYQWSAALLYHKYDTMFFSTIGWTAADSTTFTPNVDCYIVIVFRKENESSISVSEITDFMICENSLTDKTYEPCNKTTDLSESLGQTVYGGSLDVRTGKARITYGYKDLGDLTWTYQGDYLFTADDSSFKIEGLAVCSCYQRVSNYPALIGTDKSFWMHDGYNRIIIHDTSYSDATAFKTAVTGQKLAYELATPFTIQLTPHEISLLKDYAYVSTNGTSIALDYHNGELASLADVSQLGETVNELGDYVGRNNAYSYVDLTSTSYEFPNDGYIVVDSQAVTSGAVRVQLTGYNGSFAIGGIYMNITGAYQIQTTFVKKGMRARVIQDVAGVRKRFVPLV